MSEHGQGAKEPGTPNGDARPRKPAPAPESPARSPGLAPASRDRPEPIIELDNLSVRLGRADVLKGLSARLAGRAIGLLGPNGAGKSTLIRTLLGFHRPVAGRASVLGLDATSESKDVRSLIGYVPENDSFIADMSAVRFVRYMAELHGLPPEDAMERAHEALFWVGLGEARYRKVDTFSTGMKQRVKLAQAIVHAPRLVLLDEPTNGLDPKGRAQMLHLIQDLTKVPELTLLISSHLLRDVESCADQVLILKDGHVARVHDLKKERESPVRLFDLELSGDASAFLSEIAALGCEHARTLKGKVRASLPPGVETKDLFRAAQSTGAVIRTLNLRHDTLEDVFLKAMGEDPLEASHARP